jgi:hypothetical protein
VVLDDAIKRSESITPTYLLPLIVSAAVVGNTHFKDPAIKLRNLGSNLWFKAETIFFNFDTLNYFPSKDFVASLHIR